MISIDFSLAVSLYLFFIILAINLFWLLSKNKKDKDLSLDERFIWFCSVCTYNYVNTREESISTCPRCGSYNKKTAQPISP
jgi:rubrerythrin